MAQTVTRHIPPRSTKRTVSRFKRGKIESGCQTCRFIHGFLAAESVMRNGYYQVTSHKVDPNKVKDIFLSVKVLSTFISKTFASHHHKHPKSENGQHLCCQHRSSGFFIMRHDDRTDTYTIDFNQMYKSETDARQHCGYSDCVQEIDMKTPPPLGVVAIEEK